MGMTPNGVSLASVGFAGAGAASLVLSRYATTEWAVALLLFAPAMLGLRGMCNLIDGLIAVEGGLRTKSGEVFNDFPDRVADMLLFVGAGYATFEPLWGVPLGWLAAWLTAMTAYTRMLGGAVGAKQYFTGPMAKPTRMAVLSAASLCAAAERGLLSSSWSIVIGLAIVVIGCFVTTTRRLRLVVRELESS